MIRGLRGYLQDTSSRLPPTYGRMAGMNILLNGWFWAQPNVGSGQYLHGLVRWLPRVAPHHHYVLLQPHTTTSAPPPPEGVSSLTIRTPFDAISSNLAKLWFEQIGVPEMARVLGEQWRSVSNVSTLLFVPYFAPPLFCPLPVVTTIPDVIPLALPQYRGGTHVQLYMAVVRLAARRASHIITFSQYSKRDIINHVSIAASRVTPILLAADERYTAEEQLAAREAVAARYQLTEPFIYYVGGVDVRKNVKTLVRAVAQLRKRGGPPVTLAIAGRGLSDNHDLFPDLDLCIRKVGAETYVRRIDVPYEDGPLLYRACTLFAFPSRYEGFGLPPLEAMACGAPTLVSHASSLPEVVGNAAVLLDPNDGEKWCDAIEALLTDEERRNDLRQRGLQQAAMFSWHRVAKETIALLERVQQEPQQEPQETP